MCVSGAVGAWHFLRYRGWLLQRCRSKLCWASCLFFHSVIMLELWNVYPPEKWNVKTQHSELSAGSPQKGSPGGACDLSAAFGGVSCIV
jgi:hypothetical protein